MILGIDIGNYSVKVAPGINFKSLISTEENLLGGSMVIEYDNNKYIVGEGSFETELNKSNKENFLPLLYAAIIKSSNDTFNQVVCGLPINQYKANKDRLKKLVEDNKMKKVIVNGKKREIVISEFEVYPEGVGAYYSFGNSSEDFEVIIVDIGGRTTDIAYISGGKLLKSATVPVGTLNIYSEVAEKINSDYSLNLDIEYVDVIMEKGQLKVDNKDVDLSFISEILKSNFLIIKKELDLKFPARTVNIILEGGGAKLFKKAFKKRYENSDIGSEPVYANAIGFKKVGEALWG